MNWKFWIVRYFKNLKSNYKIFAFSKNHISGYTQGKLDYFFVCNKLQEPIKNTDIFAFISTDHSPIYFTLRSSETIATNVCGFLKAL